MRASALKYTFLSWVSALTMLIILLTPFHAFLTVWGSHLIGHYTALRLWKELILVIAVVGMLFAMAADHKIRSHTLSRRLVWLIIAYAAVNLIWGLVAYQQHDVTAKAFGYGLIVNLRFVAFFLLCWAVSLRLGRLRAHWQWLLLWPAGVVVLIGLAQIFILPRNFLTHFGYGPDTISPYETINHNLNYLRAFSTLRGANPLGAYLLIPISTLAILAIKRKINRKQAVLLAGSVAVLFLSFSRSAYIGLVISLAIISAVLLSKQQLKKVLLICGAVLVILGLGLGILRHNHSVQNVVLHTQQHSAIKTSSNDDHLSSLKTNLKEVWNQPNGRGTGTAGPASIYNRPHQPRIAENYYVQIAEETGLIGLTLFVLINVGVAWLLWIRRKDNLELGLFASLIGISFVCLLSHAWTDDTLAYIWWGLAGMAMVPAKQQDES